MKFTSISIRKVIKATSQKKSSHINKIEIFHFIMLVRAKVSFVYLTPKYLMKRLRGLDFY